MKPKAAKPIVKKAAPKAVAEEQQSETFADGEGAVVEIQDVPVGDQHIIPERDYTKYRVHDLVRGCWCFPVIEGSEVQHR